MTIQLAAHAGQYDRGELKRPAADPLGRAGLPRHRAELDLMVGQLQDYLETAGDDGLTGRRLAGALLDTADTRPLRRLVAYARIHLHVHQIVGLPGRGYVWAAGDVEAGRAILARAVDQATHMARCYLFIATLHRRKGAVMSAVQMIFDFMQHDVAHADRRTDDLAALFATEGASIAKFLDAFVGELAKTEAGRQALADAGRKHQQFLLPADVREQLLAQTEDVSRQMAEMRERLTGTPAVDASAA